jgi:hypothetical protein
MLATTPEFVERIMREAASPKEQAVISQEVEYLEDQIAKAKRRLDNLLELRADGDIDKETYRGKSDEAKRAIERLGAEAAALRSKLVTADSTVAQRVVSAVRVVLGGRTRLTTEQRRAILASIVRRVDVTAVRTEAAQTRGPGGRLAASGGARWAIGRISFRLALPPEEAAGNANGANVGADAGNGTARANGRRPGQSHRGGQLATTFSCWVLPGQARR